MVVVILDFYDMMYSSSLNPLTPQDLISNSPYCLLYISCVVSSEKLVLDQLVTP